MEKLGQYLLRNQVISQEQLGEALQCQVIFGGRLGTNLVELGYLSLDDLGRLLSRRSGIPAASVEELEELPREALAAIPKALVEKFKIIPMRIEAKVLHLAVCDPTDVRTMDEIAFATGMRIKPYLVPELRMFYLLERHYGIKRDIRYIRLDRGTSRGRFAAPAAAQDGVHPAPPTGSPASPGPPPELPNQAALEAKGFAPLKAGQELTDEHQAQEAFTTPGARLFGASGAGGLDGSALADADLPLIEGEYLEPLEPTPLPAEAPVPYPAPANPAETEELRRKLGSAADRDQVAGAAVRLARSQFAVVALFILNRGTLLGWKAAGGALDHQTIENVMLPAAAESVLATAAAGKVFQGAVPKGPLNDRLLAALSRPPPVSALVVPVTLKGRVVNVLYADNGPTEIGAARIGFIQLLVKEVASAYEGIILARKRGTAAAE